MNKIPNIDLPIIYEEKAFVDEEFVEIKEESGIIVEMQYPLLGMDEAIEKCKKIASIRVGMSDEDKMKMSKIPPSEYHNYIEKEVCNGKKKNSSSSRHGKLGLRYRGKDTKK